MPARSRAGRNPEPPLIKGGPGPIAIVQHEPLVPPGLIEETLLDWGLEHFVFEAWRRSDWPSAQELGALLVLGGTMSVRELDAYPLLKPSADLMAEALDCRLPTLGVCLGSQMMALVLGGEVHRAGRRSVAFSALELTKAGRDDPLMKPFAESLPVLQFHEDTFSIPDGAVVLAKSGSSGLNQAFRYGDSAYAVQFHFEVDKVTIQSWCRHVGSEGMTKEWGVSEDDLMEQAERFLPAQTTAGRNLLRVFLESSMGSNGGQDLLAPRTESSKKSRPAANQAG